MIRVAIADDQLLLRDMLQIMLVQDPEITVVGSGSNGREIVEICRETQPDLVLLDIRMPESDGIYALQTLKQYFPQMKIIMLTTFEDEGSVIAAYRHGADGYILKDVKPHVLTLAVKCIYEGLFVMHQSVHCFIKEQISDWFDGKRLMGDSVENLQLEFDRTDLAILKLLSQGSNNKEIADALNFSEGTVKNRISRMIAMTGLKDRTHIAVYALKNGII